MSSPREFVFVTPAMAEAFRREWRDIDRRFPALSEPPEDIELFNHWSAMAMLRRAARDELRQSLRDAAKLGYGGDYPVAV